MEPIVDTSAETPDYNPVNDASTGTSKIYPSIVKEYPDFYESNEIEYASVRNSKTGGDTYGEFFSVIGMREASFEGAMRVDDMLVAPQASTAEFELPVGPDECIIPGTIFLTARVTVLCTRTDQGVTIPHWHAGDQPPNPPADITKITINVGHPRVPKDVRRWDDGKGCGIPQHLLHAPFSGNGYFQLQNSDQIRNSFTNIRKHMYSAQYYSLMSSLFAEPTDTGMCAGRFRNDCDGPFAGGALADWNYILNYTSEFNLIERLALPENQIQCFARDNNSSTVDLKDLFPPGMRLRIFLPVREGTNTKSLIYNNTMDATTPGNGTDPNPVTLAPLAFFAKYNDFKLIYGYGKCRPEKWNAWQAQARTYLVQHATSVFDQQLTEDKAVAHFTRPDMGVFSKGLTQQQDTFQILTETEFVPDAIVVWIALPTSDTARDCDSYHTMSVPTTCRINSFELLKNGQGALPISMDFENETYTGTKRDQMAMALAWLGRSASWSYPHILRSTFDYYLQGVPSSDSLMGDPNSFLVFRLYVGRKENRFAGSMREKSQLSAQIKLTEAPPAGCHVFIMLLSNSDLVFRSNNLISSTNAADYSLSKTLSKPTLTVVEGTPTRNIGLMRVL
jgi:hypothetical protein